MRRERERTRLGQVLSEQLHRKKVHGAAVGVDAASQLDELRASAAALQVAQHRRLRRGACERCGASLLGHRPRERCSHWARARARPGRDMGAEWRARLVTQHPGARSIERHLYSDSAAAAIGTFLGAQVGRLVDLGKGAAADEPPYAPAVVQHGAALKHRG